jgi:hypothetical protein
MNFRNYYILGKPYNYGGPATFANIFKKSINETGGEVNYITTMQQCFNLLNENVEHRKILIINGTSYIHLQLMLLLMGFTFVMRIDGYKLSTYQDFISTKGLLYTIRKFLTIINMIMSAVLIFQSEYVRNCWMSSFLKYLLNGKKHSIVYNPVNNTERSCKKPGTKILCVEGSTGDAYANIILKIFSRIVDIVVVGECRKSDQIPGVIYLGKIPKTAVDKIYKEEDWLCYLVLEKNPACPNSVLEAMSFGLPILGINNGSLLEILGSDETLIGEYGVESDIEQLLNSSMPDKIIENLIEYWQYYSIKCIKQSENYHVQKIIPKYLEWL